MALAPLSRSSVASSFAQAPSGVGQGCGAGGQKVVVKVVDSQGAPVQLKDGQLSPELSEQLKKMGLSPKDVQFSPENTGGAKQQQRFQQSYNRDSFEPSKCQNKSAQNLQPQNTSPAQTQDAKGPSSGKGAERVAQDIAKDATSWTYDHTGGKSWQSGMDNAATFDKSKAGVCVDMAIEAEQRFEKEGVDAHVVFGKTAEGGHAWVEFKDDNGKWQAFDPTAAACTKKADDAITPYDGGPYHYQGVDETHEAVA